MSATSRRHFTKTCVGLALSLIWLSVTQGVARTLALPEQRPVATIEIPDEWRPRQTLGGIDASVNDGAVRLWVDFLPAPDRKAAEAAAMGKLMREGVAPTPNPKRRVPFTVNGFEAVKIDYSGTDRDGEADISVIVIEAPGKSGYVAVCYWGDGDAQEAIGNDLLSVTESVAVAP